MSQMIREFAQSLTKKEKSYLWDHVYRYAGVEGTTAEEHQSCNESSFGFQFGRLVEYVLNFLTGDCELEKKIFAKALKMYENQSYVQPRSGQFFLSRSGQFSEGSFGFDPKNLKSIRTRLNALGIDTTTMTNQQLRNNVRILKDLEDEHYG